MKERLLDFFRVARDSGIAISAADSIAAFDAVALVGYEHRQTLKDVLALTLAKSAEDRDRFEGCFERYFTLGGTEAAPTSVPAPSQSVLDATARSSLARILLADDRASLVRGLHAAAAAASVTDVRLFTQTGSFTRRLLAEFGIEALDEAIARLQASGDPEQLAAARFLIERRRAVAELARDIVERRLAARAPGTAERLHDRFLREARLTNIDRRDIERMRVLVRAMARRLATRYGRAHATSRRGQVDMRRTMRRNVAFDGVPFQITWKQRKRTKPRIVVLCDVSGSVAALAHFLLLFVSALAGVVADVRSFAFSNSLLEVGDILAHESIDDAIARIMQQIGFHSSDYGRTLGEFERDFIDIVDHKTSVVILGDGRTNYGDPRVDVVRRLRDRARRIVWLNPENRVSWGTDDSEMLRYLPFCHVARTCNRLRHLEEVIEDLVQPAR